MSMKLIDPTIAGLSSSDTFYKNAKSVLFDCGITVQRMVNVDGLAIYIIWDGERGTVRTYDAFGQFKTAINDLCAQYC